MSHSNSGITLPALLITLAIITVMASVSLPAYQSMMNKHQGERVLQTLARSIHTGRSVAINQGTGVTVCPSLAGKRCSGNWSDGLLVFSDGNADRRINGGDRIIRAVQWGNHGGRIRWRAFGNRQYLNINAFGHIRHQNGHFSWCPPGGDTVGAGQLIVNSTGRIRVALDRDGDGIAENAGNRAMEC